MRESKLRAVLDDVLSHWGPNTISVVEVKDWDWYQERDAQQRATIAMQATEIGQLRMLLKQSMAQMEQWSAAAKQTSPEYQKLVRRVESQLAHTTALLPVAPESLSEALRADS